MNNTIACPHCHQDIEISAAIRTQLVGEFTQKLIAQREADKKRLSEELQLEKQKLEKTVRDQVAKQESAKLAEVTAELAKKNNEIQALEKQELALRQKERDLEERQRKQELVIERKMAEAKAKWLNEIKQQEAQVYSVRLQEKDTQMAQLQKTIEELRRQSQQGSMQVQGDAAEEDLKQRLQTAFPSDQIEDVPTGKNGADITQVVRNSAGSAVGIILWESKQAKAFKEEWITKLKTDQSAAKANLAILVSNILPKQTSHFFERKGVWVCHTPLAMNLATVIRSQILAVSQMKAARKNTDITIAQLYDYVTTAEFKTRVEQLVLTYIDMKQALDKEDAALRVSLNRRSKQLDRLLAATAGLYGDVQGIMGSSLPKIEQLELEAEIPDDGPLFLEAKENAA